MSEFKDKKKPTTAELLERARALTMDSIDETESTTSSEELVTFIPGSSVIDMGELRRAQDAAQDSIDDLEETTLDEDAQMIIDEIDNDPELKKDVLSGFEEHESDETLEKISNKISAQEAEQMKVYEALSEEVASELKEMNNLFVEEDLALESSIAVDAENAEEAIESEEMSEADASLRAALPQLDENGNLDLEDLQSCVEALLFYSDRPVSLKKLKEMLEMPETEDQVILEAIELLKFEFEKRSHGFEIAQIAGGYQLRTKASKAPLLRKLAKVQVQRLSRGAMETLTIVVYKQPCTKDDIDQVRGVDSSHFIRTLLDRKLIEISGRSEAAGRPMIYQTTDTFMEVFNLMDLGGLPPLREIEAMVPQMAAAEEGQEDPRVIQMRKLVHQMKTESNHLDYDAREDEKILQDIRDRVKSIDITTPYLARQKALADQGITGEEAEALLAKEFGFVKQDQTPTVSDTMTQQELSATDEHSHPVELIQDPDSISAEESAENSENL